MPTRPRRATLATVAASAGVSVATVSKVLNGRADVAPATRALVRSLLAEHGYVPRPPHRTPVEGLVEVQLDEDLCSYSAEIITGAIEAGAASGVGVIVTQEKGTPRDGTSWAHDLVAAGRRAVITLAEPTQAQLIALSQACLPLVVIDPVNLPGIPMVSIGSTNFVGGLSATQHLLALGHRRIAYLGGPAGAAPNQARMHGYRAAMEAAGVPVRPEYVRASGGFCYPDGLKEGALLFDVEPVPTAVFAVSDGVALGAIQAARARGLRVPEDLSVVGFDDTDLAALTSPPLTTVRQPLREMGRVALRTALRLAAGETIESHHIELATELVVRGSSLAA
ncbi:LacI family DNA-binding transcriptional regulator [Nonomuraea sp. K274]|uniref:LacI family DNA-binding transcriptional regulator n=1 Tax=Nonomuraea cypriaca TaxID=1187855 RepID=A0A931A620_9ACTN|nr:LacI family DNA-binding transcriptional regulator [Nonomuraea cypriaca]MBF8185788.1 LacI family DNA-binding transcriptional regulator [Nonomuraea cypriaca]